MQEIKTNTWTIEDSAELYGIKRWGKDYFTVNADGDVCVTPMGKGEGPSISLHEIARGIEERGLSMPVLLRIENILGSQIRMLHNTFQKVFAETGYQGDYKGVFPIKVNQQEQVIEAIAEFGKEFNHGLEAGSKPELIAAISMLDNPDACLICNGYKDEEFIDLGLHALKMGLTCIFVIEVPGELDTILARAKELNVKPLLGIRVRLASRADGNWAESGGDSSVFGLNMPQTVEILDILKKSDMLDRLRLLHYHIGSQIPDISSIRTAAFEACRIYEELAAEGAPMGYLDLGGGLAVDYDGTQTNTYSSRNYSIEEYCCDIAETIITVLDKRHIPHPTIITESGRVTVSYYSVLIFNILDVSHFSPQPIPENVPESTNDLLENMVETYKLISSTNLQESYNDAIFYRDQARQMFKHGQISIRERAVSESVFKNTLLKISVLAQDAENVSDDVKNIDAIIHDIYYGNFSLFQSLPDVWAIKQFFPVMPLHRLNEYPDTSGIISDITCDCDGKMDIFSAYSRKKSTLQLHGLKPDEEYFLGVFLVGAYQETLGDLHNLFGDTNVVSVHVEKDGSYEYVRELEGDSVADVLSYVEYDVRATRQRIRKLADKAIQKGLMTTRERTQILAGFDEGLRGYTYFEKE